MFMCIQFCDIVVTQLHTVDMYLYHPFRLYIITSEHSSTSENASWDEQCHTSDMDFINDEEDLSQGEPPCMDYLNSSIGGQQLQSTHIGVLPILGYHQLDKSSKKLGGQQGGQGITPNLQARRTPLKACC